MTKTSFETSQSGSGPGHHDFNAFDRAEGYIGTIFGAVFIITGMVSAFATFSGIRLFLEEVGESSTLVNGTSVILTIATGAIVIVGWSVITKFGPEARGAGLKLCMIGLVLLCHKSLPAFNHDRIAARTSQ